MVIKTFFKSRVVLGLFLILISYISFISLLKVIHFAGCFNLNKIVYRAPFDPDLENHLSSNLSEKVLSILDQEYTYLGRGAQVFVFESNDHNYVIKFVRYFKYQKPIWTSLFSYVPFFNKKIERSLFRKKVQFYQAMQSYKIAADQLKDDTHLLYAHLNRSHCFDKKLLCRGRTNQKFMVDLDQTAFVIQEKGTPLADVLLGLRQDKKKAQEGISIALRSFIRLAQKGVLVGDNQRFVKNSGFKNNDLFPMDIGRLYLCSKTDKEKVTEEKNKLKKNFRAFIQAKMPEHLSFFEEEFHRIIEAPSDRLDGWDHLSLKAIES